VNKEPNTLQASAKGVSIWHEFVREQLPICGMFLLCGFVAAYLQCGYLPGGEKPFPIAGVRVPIWHLVWMGIWTGYTMALVGQAAGIFALPYSTSVLQFSNPHVSPTMLVLTFLNPIGAQLGFRRTGQWNWEFAIAVCAGGVVGGIVGPFVRAGVLANADAFKATLGVALALFGIQLCHKAVTDYSKFGRVSGFDFAKKQDGPANGEKMSIRTTNRSLTSVSIAFGREERTLSNIALFFIGAGVGIFSAALGVGGGFLLVPIFAIAYRIPLYVMVAATIPYTIILSATGILSFVVILPLLGTPAITPDISWGFFSATGGVFGAWWASKTQMYIPEHFLGLMLGGVTGTAGLLYIISTVIKLPFHL
jgi:uncharacterized membrane protein YfcA